MNYMLLTYIKKSFNKNLRHYLQNFIAILWLCPFSLAWSFEVPVSIPITQLGGFEKQFSEIDLVSTIEGQKVLAKVTNKPGGQFIVRLPFDISYIQYHVNNGDFVSKHDEIATVSGPAIHHFVEEYQAALHILATAKAHYESNEPFFRNRDIINAQWLSITKNYFEAQLIVEHFRHQLLFIKIDSNQNATVLSPKSGIINKISANEPLLTGESLFNILGTELVRIKAMVPASYVEKVIHLKLNNQCMLPVESVENQRIGFNQILWAISPDKACSLMLGQVVEAIPVQEFNGYKVEKSAVFEFEDINYIAIKNENTLSLVRLTLVGENANVYFFEASQNLAGKQALITSVSSVQGLMLKLGAE